MIFNKSDEEPEDAAFIIPPYRSRDVTLLEQENGMRLIVHSSDYRRRCETQRQFFAGKTLKQLLFHDDTSGEKAFLSNWEWGAFGIRTRKGL
jgi:hypothetical protein